MYHFVYLSIIETIKTGRVLYYVGKHSTNNLDDGYLGSGRVITKLLRSENKNPGKYKFTQIRSKFFESSDDAYLFEMLAISEAREKFGDKLINISEGVLLLFLEEKIIPCTEEVTQKMQEKRFRNRWWDVR